MAYAKEHNKPVIVDFSGFACVNCRKMEGAVFDTPDVRSIVEGDYVLIKLMVDDKKQLANPYTVEEYGGTTKINTVGDRWSYLQRHKFGTSTQPYYVILDNDGNPLMSSRSYDENLPEFVNWLNGGIDNYKK
jgi:thiol:disulfide interchange protein DsbD